MMVVRLCIAFALLTLLVTGTAMTTKAGAADLGYAGENAAAAPLDCFPSNDYAFIAPVQVDMVIGPGHHYDRLAVVPPCTSLAIILCEYRTAWCRVRYGRYDGWVFDEPRRDTAIRYLLGH